MLQTKLNLTQTSLSELEKVAAKGLHNAGQALGEMMGQPMGIASPRVGLVPLHDVPRLFGDPEALVSGIYLSIVGDLTGHIMLLFPIANALSLADALLMQDPGTTTELDDMAASALAEAGNITGSFFLNALADSIGLRPEPSPPAVVTDMASAILDVVLADLGQEGEEALMIETTFKKSDQEITGYFLVFPNRSSLETMIGRLGR